MMTKIAVVFALFLTVLGETTTNAQTDSQNIADIVISQKDLTSLVSALEAAQLLETLKEEGPFTVFAPVNSGFEKIGTNVFASLMAPENKQELTAILSYHIVPGRLTAGDIAEAMESGNGIAELVTLNGKLLTVVSRDSGIYLLDQKGNYDEIVITDLKASNGIIHIVKDVILP